MKTPKIIFFDIDETLYRKSSNYLPESVPAAIRALKARGIAFTQDAEVKA